MAPSVTKELKIVYGGTTIGGTSDYELTEYHEVMRGKDVAEISFTFVVASASESAFASACSAVEEEFRTPYQDLVITQDAATLLSLKQSDNTGLDARPEIRKEGHPLDTGLTRRYVVRIEVDHPADTGSLAGRKESRADVSYSPSRRRTVSFSGTWTAVSSKDAREQYEDNFDTWASARLTAYGGTYEKVEESAEETTNDKGLEFRVVYKEIISDQSSSGLDDTGIVDPSFQITRRRTNYGQSPVTGAIPLVVLEGRWEASIDNTVTTSLDTKWTAMKTWLVGQVAGFASGGAYAVVRFEPTFDPYENRISGTIEIHATDAGGSTLLESRLTVSDNHEVGKRIIAKWTGHPLAAYVYAGPAKFLRTVQWTFLFLGELIPNRAMTHLQSAASLYLGAPNTEPNPDGNRWVPISFTPASTKIDRGIDPDTLATTEVSGAAVYQRVQHGGGGGTITPPDVISPGASQTDSGHAGPPVNRR